MVRVGVASVAAGVAALTGSFSLCIWMLQASSPADGGLHSHTSGAAVVGELSPARLSAPSARRETSSFESRFAPIAIDQSPSFPPPSFAERFVFADAAPTRGLRPTLSFSDRFAVAAVPAPSDDESTSGVAVPDVAALPAIPAAPTQIVAAAPRAAAPAPTSARAPTRSLAAAPKTAPYRLASLSDTPLPPAYAPADTPTKDKGISDLLKKIARGNAASNDATATADAATTDTTNSGPLSGDMSHTAIYDISAKIVYLPDGERLEAHSGLGDNMDDVRSVNLKSVGPTPPNVYNLTLRENSFHGVQAIRLNPVDGSQMYGRAGILAHPFMLGPSGQSNGCVSVKDYPAFLKAFQRGDINRLVVVDHLDDAPGTRTASDWLTHTLKSIFSRS